MKKMDLEEIINFFYEHDIPINRKIVSSLFKAYGLSRKDIVSFDFNAKEYIVDKLFSDSERRTYFRTRNGRDAFFADIVEKRIL